MTTYRQERERRGVRTRAQENEYYDSHQPGARQSTDASTRMYGRCGCEFCRQYRQKYMSALQAPINKGAGMGVSSVHLCERCGAMATGNAIGAIQIRTSGDPDTTEVVQKEICPGCVQEMIEVLAFEPDAKQKAYKKPYVTPKETDPVDSASVEQLLAAALEKAMSNKQYQITQKPETEV